MIRAVKWVLIGGAIAALAGCILDREGQRDLTPPPVGGSGGTMTVTCNSVADCPEETCKTSSCSNGECKALPEAAGTPCGDGRTCDVASVCKKAVGVACDDASECHGGFCADAVCCDEECVDSCASCTAGVVGECSVIPAGEDPEDECEGAVLCGGERACAYGDHQWSMSYGSTTNTVAKAITVDADGNTIYAIQFTGALTVGGDTYVGTSYANFAIAKVDVDGLLSWSVHVSGIYAEFVTDIAADAEGNVYVVGEFESTMTIGTATFDAGLDFDGFVFMLDSGGALGWFKQFSGADASRANGVAVGPDGDVVVVGSYDGPVTIEGALHQPIALGDSDIYAAKFTVAGNHVWSRVFKSSGIDVGLEADVAADGTVLVGGYFNGALDTVVATATSDGTDVYVVELDINGQPVRSHTWVSPGNQRLTGVTALSAGFALAGTTDSSANFGGGPLPFVDLTDSYVAIFDGEGAHLWSEGYGAMGQQRIAAIVSDENDNIVFAGSFYNEITFEGVPLPYVALEDPFIAKLSPTGKLIWNRGWGGDELERVEVVAVGPANSVVALGELGTTTINLGGADLTNSGLYDEVFVVKLTP